MLCFVLMVGLGGVLCLCLKANGEPSVRIEASYDENTHCLTVEETVRCRNTASVPLDSMAFTLYANAYASEETTPIPLSEWTQAYPNGFSFGGLTDIRVDGRRVRGWSYALEDDSALSLQLTEALKPGQTDRFTFAYTLQVPQANGRFGYDEETVRLGGAFLLPAPLNADGSFLLHKQEKLGDPYVNPCASFAVSFRCAQSYAVLSSGKGGKDRVSIPKVSASSSELAGNCEKQAEKTCLWRFSGKHLRDFALMLGKGYVVETDTGTGIPVQAMAPSREEALAALCGVREMLPIYDRLFGRYAFPSLSVCLLPFYPGGMEYPALLLIDGKAEGEKLEMILAHETAHQWWYACVGSDQVLCPFQDEALTEYSMLLYVRERYGQERFAQALRRYVTDPLSLYRGKILPPDTPLDGFDSLTQYAASVYQGGACRWRYLHERLGDAAFFSALQTYYRQNRFRIAQVDDLPEKLRPVLSASD